VSCITFIIPTIGRPSLLKTINSLLGQSDARWKAIVVYDGVAEDDRLTIVDSRIKEIVLPAKIGVRNNGGLVRNVALDCVDTQYVGFVDDDDYLDSCYVENFYKTIPADVIVWTAKYSDNYLLPYPGRNKVVVGNVGIFFCYDFQKFSSLRFMENGAEDYLFLFGLSSLNADIIWSTKVCYHVGNALHSGDIPLPTGDNLTSLIMPKIIHQLWIGPRPCPQQYIDTWRVKNPGWEHILWDEARLSGKSFKNQAHVDAMTELNGKCDIYRYEILKEYGGFFIDADSLCLLPLSDSFCEHDSFSCYENEDIRPGLIAAGYLGCVPDCKLMDLLIDAISQIDLQVFSGPMRAWETVGPKFLTEIIDNSDYKDIMIYPSHFFIPYHYEGIYSDKKPNYAFQLWDSTSKDRKLGIPFTM
jgi:glycosyltransferase involved in cell wall biosynthesis